MPAARTPDDEGARLRALHALELLDTPPESAFDDLTDLARLICAVPIALVSLIDTHRQWFKSVRGIALCETARDAAMCAHTIVAPDGQLVVPDARLDARFKDNPLVTGEPGIRFYAGHALRCPEGHALGTLCVIDHAPRTLDAVQQRALKALAGQAQAQLHLRQRTIELRNATRQLMRQGAQLKRRSEAPGQGGHPLPDETRVDGLTGVRTRRDVEERLAEEFAIARSLGLPLAVALIDIDHFKTVNERHGLPRGDEVLRDVATLTGRALRGDDCLGRHGGGTFVVLLPNTDDEAAAAVGERIRRQIAHRHWPAPPHEMSVSVGLASLRPDIADAASLVDTAEAALHHAKATGRNRVVQAE